MYSLSRPRKPLLIFFFASILLHGAVMVVKLRDYKLTPKNSAPQDIKITFLPQGSEVATKAAKKQIVQSENAASKQKPIDPAYLSDQNRKFDRETKSRNVDIFKNAGVGKGAITQVAEKSAKKSSKEVKLSDLAYTPAPPVYVAPNRSPASAATKGLENGDPFSEGLSATNDYVQEVGLGDFTQLNTVEFKFYGFYHRIRQKLEQFWGKSIHEKSRALFRSGRRLPADQDLITSLRITMNEKGEVIKVKILGASGVRELDDAATEAFNQAGPFPNPPKDLLVNGEAVIEWGFVVQS